MRPSSRSWLCGFILKGLVQDLLSLLLKDDLSLSRVSGIPPHSPLSVFWVGVLYSLHPHVVDSGGVTPATLTAIGVVRTTVYGPFQCGVKESSFQSLTHTWSPGRNSWICSPRGNGTLSCTNLVTWFIALPSSTCSEISSPPYLRQICWHLFYYGRGPPIHNFIQRIAMGLWGHPVSEQSHWKQVHPGAVNLYDRLEECLF